MDNNYQQPQYQQPQYQQPQQAVGPQPNLLVFGILAIALNFIVGIILGAIGRSKGKKYIAQGGQLTGASKVGYILCLVGIIVTIVATVIYIIYGIILAAGGAAAYASLLNSLK
ncbi:MAG: hypothetical protein IJS78_00940 [Clostridia bacterium]|nr:hypothetical protein [Clostridia bacterium]